ncbi:MAG: hypothetical protein JEZ07_06155 [Phycisphaerae bacterium]|nr:hypothetical protein [Phycisphaerae bacterium]
MRITIKNIGVVILVLTAGLISFIITSINARIYDPRHNEMSQLLNYSLEQDNLINASDPDFNKEASELSSALINQRQGLARLLETQAPDEQILSQTASVIESNNDLIIRVVEHIVIIRKHLTAEQKQQLLTLCNDIVSGRGVRNRLQSDSSKVDNAGRRNGGGQGRGMGLRKRNRGRVLSQKITFSVDQVEAIKQLDPDFEDESAVLHDLTSKEYSQFFVLLSESNSSGEEIRYQLDKMLEAREKLELKIIEHIIRIRSLLSLEQQKKIAGICGNCGNGHNTEQP